MKKQLLMKLPWLSRLKGTTLRYCIVGSTMFALYINPLFAKSRFIDNYIFDTRGSAPSDDLNTSLTLNSQNSWVLYGEITDETGVKMPGVSVKVKGTDRGAVTDLNGKFMIEVSQAENLLALSFIGYLPQEISVGTKKNINIVMAPDEESQRLSEVQIVGYGTQKKISVTGAISTVSVKDIQRIATPTLSNVLAGSVPGIVARHCSGEPGYDNAEVYVRGFGTWAGGRHPLVLVDGVARGMNNLNTQEIESITVLKDASATAVYGLQGANGVIIITTKRGTIGKPVVIFRPEVSALSALRLPKYINGAEYASLVNEARANEGLTPFFSQEKLDKYADGSDPYLYPSVDWVNTVLATNTSQTINNLSVRGGTDVMRYYTNVGYTVLNGIYKQDPDNYWSNNSQMKRYNFRSNVDLDIAKNLSVDLSIGGIIQKGNYPGRSAPDIFHSLKITSPISFPVINPDGTIAGGTTSFEQENPYGLVARSGYSTQDHNTLQVTLGSKWDLSSVITEGLTVRGLFAYDHGYTAWNDRPKSYAIRQYLGQDADGEDVYSEKDIREESPMGYGWGNASGRTYYSEFAINYDRTFDKHNITGLMLFKQSDYVDITAGSSLYNLPYRMNGIASRATYDYDNRYLLEANIGYNGSENFPPGKQYGFFPSVSAGWIVSNEKFWNIDAVSQLKIRGSFGEVGNGGIVGRRFLFLSKMGGGQSTLFGKDQAVYGGIQESQIGNPDVTWERARKMNLGLDLELYNGRITLQADVFNEHRDNILIQRGVVPQVAGYFAGLIPSANLGEAKSRGFDAQLEVKNTTASGLFYSVRGNITYAKSTRVKDDLPTYVYPYQNPIGNLIDQPFGLISLGLFQSQEEIDTSPKQNYTNEVQPGDIKYMDVNGDGVIDIFDRVPIGYARTPQFIYGATFVAAYKGFDASVFFTGAARTSIFIDGPSMFPFQMGLGTYNITKEYYDNRWTPENPNAKYPRVSTMDNPNNNQTSTHFLQDASYIRLKSAEVGYNFGLSQLKKFGVEEIRVFVNGANLITWDKIKVIDPESNYGSGGYPLQRIVNLGAQFTF